MENDFRIDGFLAFTNLGGIEVQIADSGDEVRYRDNYNFDDANLGKPSKWQEVKYTKTGKAYFYVHSKRVYLDQVQRPVC